MCLKLLCLSVARSALTFWAMRNVILRRPQSMRTFFYMETEDSTSHESLNISTEGANKTQATAVGCSILGSAPWR